MVDFRTYMSVGLNKCAESGTGTADARQETFSDLVDLWNREKELIKSLSETELRNRLNCP